MEAPEEHTEHQSSVERTTSPILVARVAKLILATTLLSALLFPIVLEPAELFSYLPGTAAFASIYAVVWLLASRGWPLLAAWIFLTFTYAGQIGVILATGAVTEQMLVSFVNLILATGFILGRRVALVVSAVCSISVIVIWSLFMMGAMPEAVIVPTDSARLVTITCTLLATAGLTYFGVEFLTLAVERAEVHANQAEVALAALEQQQDVEHRRTIRAERLGIMARNLVGQRDPGSLTTEVAVGLRDALDAQIVLILGRSGRILATAGLGEADPPDEVLHAHADRLVEQGAFQVLGERHRRGLAEGLGIDEPELVMAARGPHTAVTVLVLGQGSWLEPIEAQWPIQVAANLLDSAMIRHESERRMLQVQKMDALNRLSSGIAHDFNNLLTTILGGAELLEHKADPTDPIQSHLKRIREAGERAASLTVKLMTFTRGAPRAREFVEMGALVSDLYPVLRRTLEESIQIELHPVTDATWVDADPIEIERIILNLVANARDAMGSTGRVDIGVDLRPTVDGGPTTVLWVQDNGEGMDLDTRTRVFEPFFTTRKGKGATGLGLSIVYGVAQALGGDVFIDSTRGTGTCVEVHLPALLEPPTPSASTPQVKATAAGAPVLVVEDDPDVRDTVCEMLRLGGYLPDAVASAEAALERLEGRPDYCLVLSDVIMPTMSGFDLANAMGEHGYDAPIALISGYAKGDNSSSEDIAPLPRITKPFSLNELLSFVQTHSA
jgi:signal transduction histidine kinase